MTPVVDAHLHLFKAHDQRYPRRVYEVMAEESREELAPALIAAMNSAGVDHAVVVPLGRGDEYLREVIAAHPSRFAGVGLYDHDDPDDLATIQRRHLSTPLQGFRFYGLNARVGERVPDLSCLPVLRYMAQHGLILWFYGDVTQITLLREVLHELPELKVVLNHLGFLPDIHAGMKFDAHRRPRFTVQLPPVGLEIVEALAGEYANIHVHFSGHYAFSQVEYPFLDLVPIGKRLLSAFGAERMLMASDWPWIREAPGYSEVLGLLDVHLPALSPADRALIRGGNALRLFNF